MRARLLAMVSRDTVKDREHMDRIMILLEVPMARGALEVRLLEERLVRLSGVRWGWVRVWVR